jgi:hypothetical protein
MGMYYENVGDYERGLKIFLSACRTSPTAETWLGAGIAFYEVNYVKKENFFAKIILSYAKNYFYIKIASAATIHGSRGGFVGSESAGQS